jgi:acetylcholinesterase
MALSMPLLGLLVQYSRGIALFVFTHCKMGLLGACQRLALASAVLSSLPSTHAIEAVTLPGYGSFAGTTVNQTLTKKALPAPVDAWLGIDYASPPVGDGRFAPSTPPAAFSGTKNATQYGFSCVQDPTLVPFPQDEACLSMNVFRPKHVSPDDKVPVLIWIHGVSIMNLHMNDKLTRSG